MTRRTDQFVEDPEQAEPTHELNSSFTHAGLPSVVRQAGDPAQRWVERLNGDLDLHADAGPRVPARWALDNGGLVTKMLVHGHAPDIRQLAEMLSRCHVSRWLIRWSGSLSGIDANDGALPAH